MSQDAFEVTSCAPKIPQTMLDHAEHSLASKPIRRFGYSEATVLLCQFEGNILLTAVEVKGPLAPERPQPKLRVAKALG